VCWGGCWGSLFTIETPEDGLPTTSRLPGTWPQAVPRRPGLRAALGRVPGMIDWIKTAQGVAAIVAAISRLWSPGGTSRPAARRVLALGADPRPDRGARAAQPRHPAPGVRPSLLARQSARYAVAGEGHVLRDVRRWEGRPADRGAATGGHHRCRVDPIDAESDTDVQGMRSAVVDFTPGRLLRAHRPPDLGRHQERPGRRAHLVCESRPSSDKRARPFGASAPPGTMPWSPAQAPIRSGCGGRRCMRRS
jgi:hypothetical protein